MKYILEYYKDGYMNTKKMVIYTGKTNAVERWFSQFKHYFKLDSSHLSFNALKTHISNVIINIPSKYYKAYEIFLSKQRYS